ncbi:MAG: hypothetical protein B7X53_09695, partial [Hyphomonas sp. 34-62-18]
DLLFTETGSLHLSVLPEGPDSNSIWRKISVAGHLECSLRKSQLHLALELKQKSANGSISVRLGATRQCGARRRWIMSLIARAAKHHWWRGMVWLHMAPMIG